MAEETIGAVLIIEDEAELRFVVNAHLRAAGFDVLEAGDAATGLAVPLSPLAVEILSEAKELSKDTPWVFPGLLGNGPLNPRSVSQAIIKNRAEFGIDHWTVHDLRRTAATLMTSLGIPRLTVSKVLNHSEGGATKIYDRHAYDAEKRQALETWSRKLESILTGKTAKIVNLIRK